MSLASFIHKSRGAEEIVEAVRLVAGGGSFFTPEIVTGGETFALGVNLATPSSEVTSRQMAAPLGISYTTIRTHLRSIDAKLGAHSQLEALRKARELGLID